MAHTTNASFMNPFAPRESASPKRLSMSFTADQATAFDFIVEQTGDADRPATIKRLLAEEFERITSESKSTRGKRGTSE